MIFKSFKTHFQWCFKHTQPSKPAMHLFVYECITSHRSVEDPVRSPSLTLNTEGLFHLLLLSVSYRACTVTFPFFKCHLTNVHDVTQSKMHSLEQVCNYNTSWTSFARISLHITSEKKKTGLLFIIKLQSKLFKKFEEIRDFAFVWDV